MARGGNVVVEIDYKEAEGYLDAVADHVGRGTKKATLEMCKEIMEASYKQVPRDTDTLLKSGFYYVEGNYKTGFIGIMGYGGNGDPINPKSGQRASQYMVAVHEDLTAFHPVGKAKFFEDPLRDYHKKVGARARQLIFSEMGGI